jgi:hypothetical protein
MDQTVSRQVFRYDTPPALVTKSEASTSRRTACILEDVPRSKLSMSAPAKSLKHMASRSIVTSYIFGMGHVCQRSAPTHICSLRVDGDDVIHDSSQHAKACLPFKNRAATCPFTNLQKEVNTAFLSFDKFHAPTCPPKRLLCSKRLRRKYGRLHLNLLS